MVSKRRPSSTDLNLSNKNHWDPDLESKEAGENSLLIFDTKLANWSIDVMDEPRAVSPHRRSAFTKLRVTVEKRLYSTQSSDSKCSTPLKPKKNIEHLLDIACFFWTWRYFGHWLLQWVVGKRPLNFLLLFSHQTRNKLHCIKMHVHSFNQNINKETAVYTHQTLDFLNLQLTITFESFKPFIISYSVRPTVSSP